MADDDETLWQRFTKDIKPIKKPAIKSPPAKPPRKKIAAPKAPVETIIIRPGLKAADLPAPKEKQQLDRRTRDKLRKGRMEIEGTLDLHGYTQSEAHEKVLGFITRAQKSGKRCVLIITGKGRLGAEGVLKKNLPRWMEEGPLSKLVLECVSAKPEHGGSGAYYIYLKRDR